MNPIFIPPASDDVESNPFDRDDSSSSGSISSESSSEGSRDESYGDDEAPLEEQGVQFSWNQDTPEYDDELEIKASPPPPGTSHANGWRSRLNSPAFLIGSAGLFLILAIVVGVGPWRDSGSSSSTNRANGLGSQTPPPVDFFASPAPTAAVVSRTDAPTAAPVPPATTTTSTTTTQATTTTSTTNTTTSTTTEQPPVTDTTTEQPPQTTEQPPTTDETPTEDPPTEELPTEEPPTTIETAGNWGQATKITYDNGVDQASFGTDVAVEDGTMVASAVNYESGSGVYVFSLGPSEWSPEPEILMGEGVRENDRFGACVDISGDTIIVGAPYENIGEDWNVGSVYVFVRDSEGQWIQQDKLVASDGASADRFGAACAIDKGTIVVGAPYADTEEDGNIGAGYVFVRDEDGKWSEQAKLLPDKENSACSESMGKYRLGTFVDINVDMVVLSPDAGLGCRRVHIFTQDGDAWSQTQEVGEDGTCAYAVSMTGRRMALGDSCAEVNGVQNAGLVTMMNRGDNGQWSGNVTITAENPGPDDFFGTDVAINGRFVLVGMSRRKSEYGGAFLYREGSGGESWDLEASMKGGERSGSSIALHNGIALLDASRDSDLGENMGGVYVFAPLEDLSPDSPERPTPEQPSQVEPTTEAPTVSPQEAEPEEPEETEEPEEPEPDDDMPQEVTFDRKDFATALDVDRGTMIVSSSGGAHIFTNGDIFTKQDGEWMHETDLVVPELPESSGFGSCVAISGGFAVVGAPNQNDNTGAAYIFTKRNGNSWEYHSTLSMTDSDTDDLYGSSCDISGGNLVVGAPKADSDEIENGQNIGAAYLYRYSNEDDAWNLENKVFPDGESECKDHFKNYKFGSVVSIDKNTVAIGPRGNGACQKAHIFALTSVGDGFQWMPQVELGETTDSENCGFSLSVSQRGKAVAIGDPCYSASDELVQIGKVSVYSRAAGPWELLGNVLLPRRPMANEMFGSSISLDGTNLLVGMMRWGRDDVAGGAWRYSLNENFNWERKELYEADEVSGGGNSVVLTGNTCMLGAPKDDGGSVLVFTFESEPDLQEEEEPAEGGSTGEESTEEEPSKEETTEEPPAEEEPAKEGPTKEEPAEPEPAAEEPAEEEPAKEEPAEEKPAE